MAFADQHFGKVFKIHGFAIECLIVKFKATENMKKLLDEGRKRLKGGIETLVSQKRQGR